MTTGIDGLVSSLDTTSLINSLIQADADQQTLLKQQASATTSLVTALQGLNSQVASVAYIDGKAVAGISGPWSGKYALTWWERPMPARELELHDSLGAAQREVEEWALRMHSGDYALPLPEAFTQALPLLVQRQRAANAAARKAGLFERMRSLLPQ